MSFNVYFHLLFNSRELNTLRYFGMKSFRIASLDSKKENKLKPLLHMRYNAIISSAMRKLYGFVVRICLSVKLAKNKCIPCLIFETFKAGNLLLSPQARNAWFWNLRVSEEQKANFALSISQETTMSHPLQ